MKTLIKKVRHSLAGCVMYELYQVLKATWFSLVSILLGGFALLKVEQAEDVIRLMASDPTLSPDLYLFLFTSIWAFTLWYCSRLVLRAAGIRVVEKSLHYFFHEWAPRVYALFPFIIVGSAYLLHGKPSLNLGSLLAGAGLSILLIYFVWHHQRIRNEDPSNRFPYSKRTLKGAFHISERPVQVFSLMAIYLGMLLVFIFMLPNASSRSLAVLLGPASIIVFGLTFWTFVFSMLAFADHKTKLPLSLVIILLVFIFSFTNNNHLIRTFDTKEVPYQEQRLKLDEHLSAWLETRQSEIESTTEYPVFVVASEGGGIRAAYWTASVLAELQQRHPSFMQHVYAISGVSGGSLGATVFTGLYADTQQGRLASTPDYLTSCRSILKNDFLSPLNAALLFPDMFQKALPFPVTTWDRARWLEDSWAEAYSTHVQHQKADSESRFDAPFLNMWSNDSNKNNVPALLLNGTRAETGEKTIISNIQIDHATFGAIDLHNITQAHIPLKTATLLSARFPLVTPAGMLESYADADGSKHIWGNVVDGGYIDNSGLETAMTIVYKLQQKKLQARDKLQNVKVYLLYIKNSSSDSLDTSGYTIKEPIGYMYEMRAPVQAFLGSWDKGSEGRIRNTKSYFTRLKAINASNIGDMIIFELDRSKETIPLGWYLSESACRAIDVQLKTLKSPKPLASRSASPFQQVNKILP